MKNYHPYLVLNGEEWTSPEPINIDTAYDEAVRMKAERNAEEAGIKVFTQGCFKIINWSEGKHWCGTGAYLYRIVI